MLSPQCAHNPSWFVDQQRMYSKPLDQLYLTVICPSVLYASLATYIYIFSVEQILLIEFFLAYGYLICYWCYNYSQPIMLYLVVVVIVIVVLFVSLRIIVSSGGPVFHHQEQQQSSPSISIQVRFNRDRHRQTIGIVKQNNSWIAD